MNGCNFSSRPTSVHSSARSKQHKMAVWFLHNSSSYLVLRRCWLAGCMQVLLIYRCCTHEHWDIGITVPTQLMRKLGFNDPSKLYNHHVSKLEFKFSPNSKPHSHSTTMKSPQTCPRGRLFRWTSPSSCVKEPVSFMVSLCRTMYHSRT